MKMHNIIVTSSVSIGVFCPIPLIRLVSKEVSGDRKLTCGHPRKFRFFLLVFSCWEYCQGEFISLKGYFVWWCHVSSFVVNFL